MHELIGLEETLASNNKRKIIVASRNLYVKALLRFTSRFPLRGQRFLFTIIFVEIGN